MAFTANLAPETKIEEAQDGMGFKIFDEGVWGTGDQAAVTSMLISIKHIDDDENEIDYDDLQVIVGGSRTKFNEFLASSGLLVETSELTIDSVAAAEIFPDGYYEITVKYNDGTYAAGQEPYFKNTQAFLATFRAMRRTMPSALLTWPITVEVREKNYDIYTLGLYLDNAEDAADLGKKVQFRTFIALIRQILDFYTIPVPW